jgi:hypothetical protein
MASSSSESWVLAADNSTASGMPPRSTSRWYLEPDLPRSVGFGPVSSPPAWRARSSCPGWPATSQAGPLGRAHRAAAGAAAATHRPAASHAAAASRSSGCRSRAGGAGSRGWIARHSCSGTRVSAVAVMAADHAHEQGEQQSRPKVGNTLLAAAVDAGSHHPSSRLAGCHVIQCERPQPFPGMCPDLRPARPAGRSGAADGSAAGRVGGHRQPGPAAVVVDKRLSILMQAATNGNNP